MNYKQVNEILEALDDAAYIVERNESGELIIVAANSRSKIIFAINDLPSPLLLLEAVNDLSLGGEKESRETERVLATQHIFRREPATIIFNQEKRLFSVVKKPYLVDGKTVGVMVMAKDQTQCSAQLVKVKKIVKDSLHEAKNVMNNSVLFTRMIRQLLESEDMDQDVFDLIKSVDAGIFDASNILNEGIDRINALDQGNVFHRDDFMIKEDIIVIVMKSFIRKAEALGVSFDLSGVPDNCWVHVNKQALKSVFRNIFDNKLKYAGRNFVITVTADLVSNIGNVVVRISDNGIPVPKELVPLLFEDDKKDQMHNVQGTGIGLPSVAAIIKEHGGDIWYSNTEGKSTFKIVLRKETKE